MLEEVLEARRCGRAHVVLDNLNEIRVLVRAAPICKVGACGGWRSYGSSFVEEAMSLPRKTCCFRRSSGCRQEDGSASDQCDLICCLRCRPASWEKVSRRLDFSAVQADDRRQEPAVRNAIVQTSFVALQRKVKLHADNEHWFTSSFQQLHAKPDW
jgi:hypothetical protein